MSFGTELRDLRKSQKLTLSQASEKAGTSLWYLCSIENDKANPSLEMLMKLSDIYGAKIEIVTDKERSTQ